MADIKTIEEHVMRAMPPEPTAHDWPHVFRVRKTAAYIAQKEGADLYIVERAALLHDIDDAKFSGDEHGPGKAAQKYLSSLGESPEVINHVAHILDNMSYKGANVPDKLETLEGWCVQDADRLDAIGPIGIARAIAYGTHKNRLIYNPDIPVVLHDSPESYRNTEGTSINHFYEKLLLLKDRMKTETGRELAVPLHRYMELYLESFLKQWNGIV
jgi:uncharacterized protein